MGPGGPDQPDTAVVIVNYRTGPLTRDAVGSVTGEPGVAEVVVIDNASDDGSADFLERELSDPRVRVVRSPINGGFGHGVNLGVEHCTAPLLFVLNSDATLVPGSLAAMRRTLLADESVAVVAPAVYGEGGRELQRHVHGVFPTLRTILLRANVHPPETLTPDWVSGAAMLVRRRDFQAIGGFDADFGMYLEDVDLCRRFRTAGREIRRELRAGVIHGVGRSCDSYSTQLEWAHRSRVLYFRKSGASRAERAVVEALRSLSSLVQRSPWRRTLSRSPEGPERPAGAADGARR